jgi:hypothetical protein
LIERRKSVSVGRRLLAVALMLALAVLAAHAVSHAHANAYDEDHCQICHMGHAAIPQPGPQVALQAPSLVERLAIGAPAAPHLDFLGSPSIPRAPPA